MNKTTITITDTLVEISTNEVEAMNLVKKNPECLTRVDSIEEDCIVLTYNKEQLMRLSSLIKTGKKRTK